MFGFSLPALLKTVKCMKLGKTLRILEEKLIVETMII
jgi:hypothetical protein